MSVAGHLEGGLPKTSDEGVAAEEEVEAGQEEEKLPGGLRRAGGSAGML